jgi:hypothetical protein
MRIAASAIERGRDDMETFGTELRKRGSYIDEARVAKKRHRHQTNKKSLSFSNYQPRRRDAREYLDGHNRHIYIREKPSIRYDDTTTLDGSG